MRRRDLRGAGVLARTELRARVRQLAGNRRRLLATGFVALQFTVLFPLFLSPALRSFGGELTGSGEPPVGVVGLVLCGTIATGVYGGAATTITQNRIGAVGPLVRTSIPPRAVTLGRLASETLQANGLFVPPVVAVLVIVGIGAGGPVAPALLAVAALPALAAAFLLGRLLGAALRYVDILARLSAWTKAGLFLVVMVGMFAGSQALFLQATPESSGEFSLSLPVLLPGAPLQAFAGIALSPLGAPVRPLGVAVAGLVLAAIPIGLVATVRAETALQFAGASRGDADGSAAVSRAAPRLLDRRAESRVAWRYLLRTARDPKMLGHLAPVLFGLLGAGGSLVSNPGLAVALGPDALVVIGVVLAGATYGLNPMGDDRDQLPLLLTSARSTALVLRGRAVAGVVVGLAFAVGVGVPLGLVEQSPALVAGRALLAVPLLFAAAGTALGLGALVPKFERREYMNVERAHPSTFAVLGFSFGGAVVGGIGLLLLRLSLGGVGLPVLVGAWAVYLAVLGLLGAGGYAYAVRKFDALTLDAV